MTAIARCKAMANEMRNLVNWLASKLAITFRAHECDDDRESRRPFFRTKVVLVH